MIFDHTNGSYWIKWKLSGANKYNGAYYYSKEIVKNIIPNIKTDRNWVTINVVGMADNHSIVFIHNNLTPSNYNWLSSYKDLILVCGIPETMEKVKHLGTPIYLPLSIDVKEVEQYRTEKTKEVAFVGRPSKRNGYVFPEGTDILENMPRPNLLSEMAKYKKIYGVGRVALEAKCLGCEILPYDERYPDTERWVVMDNSEAVQILQEKLNEVDRR